MRWIAERRKAVEDWLGPFLLGLIEGVTIPLILAVFCWGAAELASLTHPAAQLFRDLSQIGAALFIAFAVATGGASAFSGGNLVGHLRWLGTACGFGLSGFFAIGASIALAAYRDAGHAGRLDLLGLCWVTASLGLLGIFVALLPYETFHWSRADE